jgi:hypothetical protein
LKGWRATHAAGIEQAIIAADGFLRLLIWVSLRLIGPTNSRT